MRKTLFAAAMILAGTSSTLATQTWCATVAETPDGFLALRGSPSAQAPMLAKLPSGSYVEVDTAQCERTFDADRNFIGDVCAEAGWVAIEYAKILDVRPYDRDDHGGWVAERYLVQQTCEWDED
ncbi:MAG: hypothetical protein ABIO40_06110 [Devosia sp.]